MDEYAHKATKVLEKEIIASSDLIVNQASKNKIGLRLNLKRAKVVNLKVLFYAMVCLDL